MRAAVLSFAVIVLLASNSSACDGDCGSGYGMGYLYNSLEYNVPYFAAHPPVYYSQPVPRTYGYSPFAYPPHFRTPDVADSAGPVMVNPYSPSSAETPAAEAPVADPTVAVPKTGGPLVQDNPYVKNLSVAANIGN